MSSTPESVSATRRLQKALTKQKKITLAIRYVKWDYTLSHVRLHEIDDVLRTHKAFVTHGWTAQQMAGWESKLSELSEDRQEWASCLLSAREEWNGYMKHFHRLENSISELRRLVASEMKVVEEKRAVERDEEEAEEAGEMEEAAEEEAEDEMAEDASVEKV